MDVDYKVISGRGNGSFHHHISRQIKTRHVNGKIMIIRK
jgi:hypothetical protein